MIARNDDSEDGRSLTVVTSVVRYYLEKYPILIGNSRVIYVNPAAQQDPVAQRFIHISVCATAHKRITIDNVWLIPHL